MQLTSLCTVKRCRCTNVLHCKKKLRERGGGGGGGAKTTQEHLFTSHRSASEVSRVDSDILKNFSRNGGYMVVAGSHSIIFCV